MGILIDTSALVAHERGHLDPDTIVDTHLRDRDEEPFYISVVTVSELLHGAHRAKDRTQRARRTAFVEGVIDAFPVLPIDLMTARAHAELGAGLVEEGTPVGTHDLWIAAAAVARGLSLVTLNRREFERVPGLELEVWEEQP